MRASAPLRAVSRRFKTLSRDSIRRHRLHLDSTALVKLVEAHREVEAMTLVEEIASLKRDAHRLRQKAEDSGDLRCALAAVKSLGEIVLRLEELMPTSATEAPVVVSFSFPPSGRDRETRTTNDPNENLSENVAAAPVIVAPSAPPAMLPPLNLVLRSFGNPKDREDGDE